MKKFTLKRPIRLRDDALALLRAAAVTKAERYAEVMAQVLSSSRARTASTPPAREGATRLAPGEGPAANAVADLHHADDDPFGHGGCLDAPE